MTAKTLFGKTNNKLIFGYNLFDNCIEMPSCRDVNEFMSQLDDYTQINIAITDVDTKKIYISKNVIGESNIPWMDETMCCKCKVVCKEHNIESLCICFTVL